MLPCLSASPVETEAASTASQTEVGPNVGLYAPAPLCVECGALPGAAGEYTAGMCVICLTDDEKRLRHGLGVKDFSGPAALPPRATDALPGSEAKLVALEERARLGQALWHPDDTPMCPEARAADGVDGQVGLRHSHGRVVSLPKEVYLPERASILDIGSAGAW